MLLSPLLIVWCGGSIGDDYSTLRGLFDRTPSPCRWVYGVWLSAPAAGIARVWRRVGLPAKGLPSLELRSTTLLRALRLPAPAPTGDRTHRRLPNLPPSVRRSWIQSP